MVFQPKPALSVHDWLILGHEVDPENPHVPMRRCDMPIPYNMDGLNVLTHRIAGLSLKLQKLVEDVEGGKATVRQAIGCAARTIKQEKLDFADLARDWDDEYRQLLGAPHLKLTSVEPIGTKRATGE